MCCITKPRRRAQSGGLCCSRTEEAATLKVRREDRLETPTAPGDSSELKHQPLQSCFSFAQTQPPASNYTLPRVNAEESHTNGTDKHRWRDGANYDGQYRNGLMHGKGLFVWATGAAYDGDFVEGCLQGSGIMKWPDGSSYEGSWKNGLMHGFGHSTWSDGRSYEGEYCHDLKHGHGIFKWPDGRQYNGHWMDGAQHGKGTLISASGKAKNLEFIAGQRVREQSKI